jgi:hypothetical protein
MPTCVLGQSPGLTPRRPLPVYPNQRILPDRPSWSVCANSRSGSRGLLDQIAGVARQEKPKRETVERRVTLEILLCGDRR